MDEPANTTAEATADAMVHETPRLPGMGELEETPAAVAAVDVAAPTTPRTIAAPESPRTPRDRIMKEPRSYTPPPLVPRDMLAKPLLRALQMGSVERVRAALLDDPEAANEPFWDHCCDLPLCYAVRKQCKSEIVKLLLDHGADKEGTDMRGRTAAQILWQTSARVTDPPMSFDRTCGHLNPQGYQPAFTFALAGLPRYFNVPSAEEVYETWRREVSDLLTA